MTQQQDLTAPPDPVKVSRREEFKRGYAMYQDEATPMDLTGLQFKADLFSSRGYLLTLTEAAGITRPNANTVAVQLTTLQMGQLPTGQYSLVLYSERGGERDTFVNIALQVT